MTRRDWYVGIAVIALALLIHALFPRYEYRPYGSSHVVSLRVDRWTGTARRVRINPPWGSQIDQ